MNAITRFITAAKTSWIVLVVGIAATAGLFVAAGYQSADAAPPVGDAGRGRRIRHLSVPTGVEDDEIVAEPVGLDEFDGGHGPVYGRQGSPSPCRGRALA